MQTLFDVFDKIAAFFHTQRRLNPSNRIMEALR